MLPTARARCRLVIAACAVYSASVGAQQIATPFVANSANNVVSEVFIDPPVVSQVNANQNVHARLTSLVSRPTFQYLGGEVTDIALNLYGTDQSRGELIEWVEPTNESPVPPAILWQPAYAAHPAAGTLKPTAPTGLGDDPAGNLFVVHSTRSTAPGSVWVFRYQELSPEAAAQSGAPWPPQPRVIDRQAGAGAVAARTLEETVVAPTSAGAVSIGDLLVLARDPAMVLAYPLHGPHGIADILAQSCIACAIDVEPTVLLAGTTPITLADGTTTTFGALDPTGMDFYDDDLLIVTGRGEIVRVDLDALAAGLPAATIFYTSDAGKSRLKTAFQGGGLAVFVSNQNRGSLLRILASGDVDEVTGLQNPEGLTVTNVAYEPVANCIVGNSGYAGNGCDPTVNDDAVTPGGGQKVFVQSVSGLGGGAPGAGVTFEAGSNLLQDFCIVPGDDVSAVVGALPAGASPQLSDFCPGWGANVNPVIPPYLVKAGEPLVFIESTAPGLEIKHGLMRTIAEQSNLLPDYDESESCPSFRTAWSPSKPGDRPVALDGAGNPVFEENLTACGSLYGLGRGGSFYMFGPFSWQQIPGSGDEYTKMRAFVLGKFDLFEKVATAAKGKGGNVLKQITRCMDTARRLYTRASAAKDYASVLDKLADCEAQVSALAPGSVDPTIYPNPAGDMLWRILNIEFTIALYTGL
jgi:hypothetical protein